MDEDSFLYYKHIKLIKQRKPETGTFFAFIFAVAFDQRHATNTYVFPTFVH